MADKKIAIIGAGISGLAAGCYAQMNGFESSIYESHNIPGGLCTSWKRGDYTFDGCIDWLTGSGPDGMFHPIWQELGVIKNNTFHYEDEYCRYIAEDGTELVFHLDIDKLEREFNRISPQDSDVIKELCDLIRSLKGFRPNVAKAMEVMSPLDFMKMMMDLMANLKQYRNFFKYGKTSMEDFSSRFRNPELKNMFSSIWNSEIPVSLFASIMAWCSDHTAGYPVGGSLKFAKDMEKRYLGLGGKINYRQRVKKITVEAGKATGLVLSDGREISADIVISAADGYSTIFSMLEGKYISEKINNWYENAPAFPPYIQISLGVNRDLTGQPRLRYWRLKKPLMIAERETPYMIIHNYSFDNSLAPSGKTPLVIRFFTDYGYWDRLSEDRIKYRSEKETLAMETVERLEELYPGISGQIEVMDIATPSTYVRYTETWKGSTMSWLPTTSNFGKNLGKTLPGLESFYMAGQWLVPSGGLPNGVKTGRDVIQIICKKNGKKFTTSVA